MVLLAFLGWFGFIALAAFAHSAAVFLSAAFLIVFMLVGVIEMIDRQAASRERGH